jgi:prephenate dehydratase
MKISIQGNIGSYSHIAALDLLGYSHNSSQDKLEIIEREKFEEVFQDLSESKVEAIVIPIENSTHGSVYQNYDNMTKNNFVINGEIYLKINFHLIGQPETALEKITKLYSHPVGLNQINRFLHENQYIKPFEYQDTAGSVKMISELNRDSSEFYTSAAAASRFAAETYGMKILKENIQENSKNYTRFFLIQREEDPNDPENNKTTVQFELGEESGSLYKALRCFADRDIALSKIESRPIINTDWEYRFYVDVGAGTHEEKLMNAFREFGDYAKGFRVLGSYRKGVYIDT